MVDVVVLGFLVCFKETDDSIAMDWLQKPSASHSVHSNASWAMNDRPP